MRLQNLVSLLAVGASAVAVYPKRLSTPDAALNNTLSVQNAATNAPANMTLTNSTATLDLFACQLLLLELLANSTSLPANSTSSLSNSTQVQKRAASTTDTASDQAAQQNALSVLIETTIAEGFTPTAPKSVGAKRAPSNPGKFIEELLENPKSIVARTQVADIGTLSGVLGSVESAIETEKYAGPFVSNTESMGVAGASGQGQDPSKMAQLYKTVMAALDEAIALNKAAIAAIDAKMEQLQANAESSVPLGLADVPHITAWMQLNEISEEVAEKVRQAFAKIPQVKAALDKKRAQFLSEVKLQAKTGKMVASQGLSAAKSSVNAKGKALNASFRSFTVSTTNAVIEATLGAIEAAKSVSAATKAGAKAFSAAFKSALAKDAAQANDPQAQIDSVPDNSELPQVKGIVQEDWASVVTESLDSVTGENSDEQTDQPAELDGTPVEPQSKGTTPESTTPEDTKPGKTGETAQNPGETGETAQNPGETGETAQNPGETGETATNNPGDTGAQDTNPGGTSSSDTGAEDTNPVDPGSEVTSGEGTSTTNKHPTVVHPPKARRVVRAFVA